MRILPITVVAVFACMGITSCASWEPAGLSYRIVGEGLIDCFPPGLQDPQQDLVYCEASGVAMQNGQLLLASDKDIPIGSAVFSIQHEQGEPVPDSLAYMNAEVIKSVKKIEDLAITPDKKYLIATTAFDRYLPKNAKWDFYNSIIYWPVGKPEAADIAMQSQRDGVFSSVSFRQQLIDLLGHPYFKVEGLSTLPNDKLILGVRELGQSYKKFDYKVLIISLDYSVNQHGKLVLGTDLNIVLNFKPDTHGLGLPRDIGLSSLEYIPSTDSVFISTSWEKNAQLGGCIWQVSREQLMACKGRPTVLLDALNKPLLFKNKIEGIASIDPDKVFAIHDDDRETGRHLNRQAHQAAYSLISK